MRRISKRTRVKPWLLGLRRDSLEARAFAHTDLAANSHIARAGCTFSAFRSLTSLAWHARQIRLRTGSSLAKN
jgi:hypothetical protein